MSNPPFQPADASRVREQALDWFVRRRDESFGTEEERAFQSWLTADPAHRQAFEHWQREWQAFDDIPQDMRGLLQRKLAHGQAMDAASSAGAERAATRIAATAGERPTPSRRRVLAPALAAAVIATVAGGTGLLAWNHWQARPVFMQAFGTQRGQQTEVPLPDGTRLRLDTATRLEVSYYRQYREVKLLDGQAVFAVQHDAGRPFHVLAGPMRITVVGTTFSVRHTPGIPGDAGVDVAVEEGRVRVARNAAQAGGSPAHDEAIMLTAGQQISSDAAGVLSAISFVTAGGIAPWREYRVRFDNQRLDQALAELARYGDPRLLIRDPAVAALPITGVFDPRDMATFRRVLPASLPVRLKAAGGGAAEVELAH
ncbi:MAG: FecR domain-containing protein [Burkholderiaceae bacterium]